METAFKNNSDTRRKNVHHYYIRSLYPFHIQKFVIPLFSASHDNFKARVFRNNPIPFRIFQ